MATIKKFADIKAWQEGRKLAMEIYAQTRKPPFSKDFGFCDQIQRAVVSINSNIAEGFERDSNLEFAKFLGYAKGSAGELLSQLITAHDIGYLDEGDFNRLSERAGFVSVLIAKLRDAIATSSLKGPRWKSTPPATLKPRDLETLEPRNLET